MTQTRVYVGCLACYNAGRLVGDWVDIGSAAEWSCPQPIDYYAGPHEETWVMDHELGASVGELSPFGAVELGAELDAAERLSIPGAVYLAWRSMTCETSARRCAEQYLGAWASVTDMIAEHITDGLYGSDVARVFDDHGHWIDLEAMARDEVLGGEIWTHDDGDQLHIFSNR